MSGKRPLIRRFWTIILLAPLWSAPGWSVTYRVNAAFRPRYGLLTPALVEWKQ